jgi:hypothetical protein
MRKCEQIRMASLFFVKKPEKSSIDRSSAFASHYQPWPVAIYNQITFPVLEI